jgi:hypothetical protein
MRKPLVLLLIVFMIIQTTFAALGDQSVSTPSSSVALSTPASQQAPDFLSNTSTYLPLVVMNYTQCPVYTFLDCKDLGRIRAEIQSGGTHSRWEKLKAAVDDFIQYHFPTEYNNTDKDITTWYPPLFAYAPRSIALVYLVTGESFYGQAVYNLLDLIVRNTPPRDPDLGPDSGLFAGYITASFSYPGVIFAYSAIRKSTLVTPNDQLRFDSFFLTQAQLLEETIHINSTSLGAFWSVANPWMMSDLAVSIYALALYDDARFQQIYQRSRERIDDRLNQWFDNDGGWLEKADNYTTLVLQQLLLYQETLLKILGEDIFYKSYHGKSIAEICQWYPKILPPDGLAPGLNDGGWEWLPFLQLCAFRSRDPALAFAVDRTFWGANNSFEERLSGSIDGYFHLVAWADSSLVASPPDWTSALLPDTGLAALRSDWSTDAQYLLFEFPQSFHHLHYNFGNIVLYDQGPWLLDNGYQSSNEHYRSIQSIDHSTTTVDNQNHIENHGEVEFYTALNQYAIVSAYAKTYPLMYQRRTVLWGKPWHQWLVIDELYPLDTLPHSYQQRWYVFADQVTGSGNHWAFSQDGKQLFIDLVPTPTGGPVQFSQISRTYSGNWIGNALGVMMESSYFYQPAALITTPQVGENQPGISNVSRQDNGDLMVVTSQREYEIWAWLYSNKPLWVSDINPYALKGLAGCVLTRSENLDSYCMFDGEQLSYQGQLLANASTAVSVDVSFSLSTISLDAPDSCLVSVYWPGQVSAILDESGSSLPFTYASGMLSFTAQAGTHTLIIQGK